jgi:hypothetical protein
VLSTVRERAIRLHFVLFRGLIGATPSCSRIDRKRSSIVSRSCSRLAYALPYSLPEILRK